MLFFLSFFWGPKKASLINYSMRLKLFRHEKNDGAPKKKSLGRRVRRPLGPTTGWWTPWEVDLWPHKGRDNSPSTRSGEGPHERGYTRSQFRMPFLREYLLPREHPPWAGASYSQVAAISPSEGTFPPLKPTKTTSSLGNHPPRFLGGKCIPSSK